MVNLDRSMVQVSVTELNRPTLKSLNSIRPNHISFSQYLGLAAKEYYENHKTGMYKITDFAEDSIATPQFFSDIELWRKYVEKCPRNKIKDLQKRHQQIGNILNKRVEKILNG